MTIWRNCALIAGLLTCSAPAGAYNALLNVTGSIKSNTCNIDAGSKDVEVPLGTLAIRQFTGQGMVSTQKKFSILLRDCTASATSVKVGFYGLPDEKDSSLIRLSSGGATGLGIGISDDQHNPIPVNTLSKTYTLMPEASNALTFYGYYKSTSEKIKAGSANGVATFTVEYN